jgi:hypothetical protein
MMSFLFKQQSKFGQHSSLFSIKIIKVKGGNNYKSPHMNKDKWVKKMVVPSQPVLNAQIRSYSPVSQLPRHLSPRAVLLQLPRLPAAKMTSQCNKQNTTMQHSPFFLYSDSVPFKMWTVTRRGGDITDRLTWGDDDDHMNEAEFE